MGFPRQEYGSKLPLPSPGDRPDPGIKPTSPTLAGGFFTAEPLGRPQIIFKCFFCEQTESSDPCHRPFSLHP